MTNKLTTFLWFRSNALEAARLYCDIFDGTLTPMGMGASFEIAGQRFVAFNGGPAYELTPAVSIYVPVKTQAEIDTLWARFLAEGGTESRCGWLVDRFGLSWQIIPDRLMELLTDRDAGKAQRAQQAMMKMSKIVIADLEAAAAAH